MVDRNYCPYKALEAFTPEDKDFFFGRDNLTQEIIKQLETTAFLPVVGASGSGKSSVVQAGVIPRLRKEGIFNPENNRSLPCQIWILRPGEDPIQELAITLSNHNHSPDYLEGILHLGVESFVAWLRKQPQPMGVLVIDRFEELFTLTSDFNRDRFLELIDGALLDAGDRFKVITTLRDDFMASCLEIPSLGEKVKQAQVLVPSYLTEEEYRQIIIAPATKVGLSVEPELVDVLLEEVSQEKNALPLLEFTLEQLWQNRVNGSLSLRVYQEKIGGIKKVLQARADGVYGELTKPQQECAQWIFTQSVCLKEGKEYTSRRRNLSELIVPKYSQKLIKSTLNILRESRLIVMSDRDGDVIVNRLSMGKPKEEEVALENSQLITVEIAHEILINNWQQLRWWLDENREQIRLRQRIEEKAAEWFANEQKRDYLLRGTALAPAEEFYIKYADELSIKSQEFIAECIEERDREAKLAAKSRLKVIGSLTGAIVVISMFAGAALWQLRRATINEINALNNSAESLLLSSQNLEALVTGLKAGKKIKNSWFGVDRQTEFNVLGGLQNILYQIKEINRLESHRGDVTQLAFSPDGQTIASASRDETIKLWDRHGKLLVILDDHTDIVSDVVFSPDGKTIASASRDETVKLWDRHGKRRANLNGHKDSVNDVAFSPDGQTIASASKDKTVKLWDRNGKLLATLKSHTHEVNEVTFSPDSQTIASTSWDGTVKLWDRQGNLLATFDGPFNTVEYVAFSLDSQTIVSAGKDKTVKLWDRQGNLLATFDGHTSFVNDVAFSPDGQTVAFASSDKTVKLWDRQGELLATLDGHFHSVEYVAFSPDGKTIASASSDKTVKLWDRQGKLLTTLDGHTSEVYRVAFSPDGQTIASASSDETVKLWNRQGKLLATLDGHTSRVNLAFSPYGQAIVSPSGNKTVKLRNGQEKLFATLDNLDTFMRSVNHVAFSPDGEIIASASSDETVKLWDRQGKLLATLYGHTNRVYHVAFSPDGQTIASASWDDTVKLWNRQGKLLATLYGHFHSVYRVAFSPDGQTIASASGDGTVKLWNRQGKLQKTLYDHTDKVYHVAFSPDGQTIASASGDGTVKLWDRQGKLLATLGDHAYEVYHVAFSPDGQTIAFASWDETIKLWNRQGKVLATLKGHTNGVSRVAFSPDGQTIASVGRDKTVKLWNRQGKLLATLKGHTSQVLRVAFSPDGQTIASASWDNTVKLWDRQGKLLATLKGHSSKVSHVAFSPNGQAIVSASWDATIKLWSLDLDDVLKQGCNWARDYLTHNPNVSEEDRKICDGI